MKVGWPATPYFAGGQSKSDIVIGRAGKDDAIDAAFAALDGAVEGARDLGLKAGRFGPRAPAVGRHGAFGVVIDVGL